LKGLYAGVAIGIGGPMGSLLSGFVWVHYSPASIFLIAAVFSTAGFLLLMMEYYGKSAPPSPTDQSNENPNERPTSNNL